jgi:dipeptidase E
MMRFLLTSGGISNTSIHTALEELLGKPIAQSSALCIPTAMYARPNGPALAWRQISGVSLSPMCEVEWKSLGVLELTALPSIKKDSWLPLVQQTDALLVGGVERGQPATACLLLPWLRLYPLPHLTADLADLCALMNTYHPLHPT